MSSVWLGWKITRKFLFTLREDDPDENKESRLNNGKSSGSASQLSFTNLLILGKCEANRASFVVELGQMSGVIPSQREIIY